MIIYRYDIHKIRISQVICLWVNARFALSYSYSLSWILIWRGDGNNSSRRNIVFQRDTLFRFWTNHSMVRSQRKQTPLMLFLFWSDSYLGSKPPSTILDITPPKRDNTNKQILLLAKNFGGVIVSTCTTSSDNHWFDQT